MSHFASIPKVTKGDKVAIVSPSFAAPGKFPHVYELGLQRLREEFELEPVEYPTTRQLGASTEERARDLIAAFTDPEIKAVIATIGGNDQVTYVKNLPIEPFRDNPKAFFGFSDNSHFENFLWLNEIPSYYGGSLMTQFAMQKRMDPYTQRYLRYALFEEGERELVASESYNDQGLNWTDPANLDKERIQEKSDGWYWDGESDAEGSTWGGCVESVDEMLRHNVPIPKDEEFNHIVLCLETSEEIPSADYVFRVLRAFGERGLLARVRAVLVGRPKAWEFHMQKAPDEKEEYRKEQRQTVLKTVRAYNLEAPVIQNMNFGHTDPQIPLPYGRAVRIQAKEQKIFAMF